MSVARAYPCLLAATVMSCVLGCAHDSASQSGDAARDEAAGSRASPPDSARADSTFDRIFEDTVAEYRLPGLALGVIADGEVAYQRTAGETVAGSGRPIDGDTLFKIASNSKAMTTGVLARLVDAGRLDWDDPVVRHLPAFRMHDPWITPEIQVRDLLIHNSGLREGAGDLMFWPEPNSFTRSDVIAGLAHLAPQYSFRSRYAYDNLMYVVAGEVAAAAGGLSYEELVRREIFVPLGMSRCQAGAFRRDSVGNVAQPHMSKDGQNVPVRVDGEEVPLLTSAAAGGIRCSLNDMLKWLKLWLDPGMRVAGGAAPWLTREQREAVWTPHTPMRISQRQRAWDGSRFSGYGYGWRVSDVDGVLRVAHTGTLMGMYSAVVLLPEKRSGFVFMINGDGSAARVVLTQLLVEHFTDPGSARSVADYARELARDRDPVSAQSPPTPPPPPRQPAAPQSLRPMLGVYRDPWFGEVSLCEVAGAVQFRSMKSPLMAGIVMSAGERWLVDWIDESVDAEAWLQITDPPPAFAPAGAGKAPQLTLSKVDPEADFSYDYEDLAFTRTGACETTRAQEAKPGADATVARVDELMRDYQGAGPGASVLVLRDGEPIVRRSYGFADVDNRIAATPQTNFRLASVTKQFTAAAILLLVQDGKLSLNDRAQRWLPSLPDAARGVTIRHLLSHMSGLIDYEDVVPASLTRQLHDSDVLDLLEKQDRSYFAPGSSYRYSNSGYALLALIVERASGKSFATFLRERIFVPLGMNDTVAHEEGMATVANRAFGHSSIAGAWRRTDQSQTSAVLGDGGIYSSIDDLARWDAALHDDRLLSDESRRLAFTPVTPTDDPTVQYGFGWRITGETLWHSGETMGFRNVLVRYPQRRLTVIVLTNRDDPEPYRTALAIAALYLPQ